MKTRWKIDKYLEFKDLLLNNIFFMFKFLLLYIVLLI